MKTLTSANLLAHLAGEYLSVAILWKITRTDGQIFGFTDHDVDIVFSGVTYKAATGVVPAGIEQNSDMSVDNTEVSSFLDSSSITESDLLAGLWNHALIDVMRINYRSIADGVELLPRGRLGEIRVQGGKFTAEVRSNATQALQQIIGEVYTPGCRANLFDARCKLVAASFTVTGSLTAVTSQSVFFDSTRTEVDDWFGGGLITWTGGGNVGLTMEVKSYVQSTKRIELMLPMPRTIIVGDTYSLISGCRKRMLIDCKTKYNNIVNFRGEAYVPGLDNLLN